MTAQETLVLVLATLLATMVFVEESKGTLGPSVVARELCGFQVARGCG